MGLSVRDSNYLVKKNFSQLQQVDFWKRLSDKTVSFYPQPTTSNDASKSPNQQVLPARETEKASNMGPQGYWCKWWHFKWPRLSESSHCFASAVKHSQMEKQETLAVHCGLSKVPTVPWSSSDTRIHGSWHETMLSKGLFEEYPWQCRRCDVGVIPFFPTDRGASIIQYAMRGVALVF